MIKTIDEFMEYWKDKKNIYLFGAGKRATEYVYILRKSGFEVKGFLVSQRGDNPSQKDGLPVVALEELSNQGMNTEEIDLFFTLAGDIKKWLKTVYELPTFRSVFFVDSVLYGQLKILEFKYKYEDAQDKYLFLFNGAGISTMENFQALLVDKATGKGMIRMPGYLGNQLFDDLLAGDLVEDFRAEFGAYDIIPCKASRAKVSPEKMKENGIELYVVTSHLDQASPEEIEELGCVPIQVGAALTDVRKGCITDDTGENISNRNRDYSECTSLYWIWKNTNCQEYVGISHYRRRLLLDDGSIDYLMESGADLVAAHPQYEKVTIQEFFAQFICELDWNIMVEELIRYDASYADVIKEYENGHFYFPCNVQLWKREWFDRYCEFVFTITQRIWERYVSKNICREDRYMGYLFEQLSSVFIMKHFKEMKVLCTQIEWKA